MQTLKIAQLWAETQLAVPSAIAEAIEVFQIAAESRVPAIMVFGRKLTTNRIAYLCRWDGEELVVRHLPGDILVDWNIGPEESFQDLGRQVSDSPRIASNRQVSLLITQIDASRENILSGLCEVSFLNPNAPAIHDCVLRADYFRPDIPEPIWTTSGLPEPLVPSIPRRRFKFPPVIEPEEANPYGGIAIVFYQMFSIDHDAPKPKLQRISNVTSTEVFLF